MFLGWGENQTGTEVVYQPGDMIKAENRYSRNGKSLFARWEKAPTHAIDVENGVAARSEAAAGETVTIRADTRENFTFDHWEVVSGGVTVKEPTKAGTTFLMGDAEVSLKAVYRYTAPYLAEFSVNMTPPVAGALPEAPTVDSELYTVSAYSWVGVKDDVSFQMAEGERFEAGVFYQCRADLLLSGCQADDKDALAGYVNGSAATDGMDVIISRLSFDKVKVIGSFNCAGAGEAPKPATKENPFVDVKESDLFYNAVLWAYYHDPQITKGMDDTHFGPNLTVTRAQAVTFLWRAEGCPKPASMASAGKFVDVTADWYREAVAWAVENGVTNGVDDTHFDPDGTLTTAHIVTFLYRAENPGKNGWYEEARSWAEYHEILYGIPLAVDNGTFCPRSAVVMLLCNLFARE